MLREVGMTREGCEERKGEFLSDAEDDIAKRFAMRLVSFLESEVSELPPGHPTASRYRRQIARLRAAYPGLRPLR